MWIERRDWIHSGSLPMIDLEYALNPVFDMTQRDFFCKDTVKKLFCYLKDGIKQEAVKQGLRN